MMQEAISKFKIKSFRFIFNQSVRKQKDKERKYVENSKACG